MKATFDSWDHAVKLTFERVGDALAVSMKRGDSTTTFRLEPEEAKLVHTVLDGYLEVLGGE